MARFGRLALGQRQHRRRGLEGAAVGALFVCVAAVRLAHAQASHPIRVPRCAAAQAGRQAPTPWPGSVIVPLPRLIVVRVLSHG